MEENGGFATLGYLNQNVFNIKDCRWNTKTPFASIRRIVQDGRFFFKIRPGLWALKSYKNRLPEHILPEKEIRKFHEHEDKFGHSYYQGLLVEIGNSKGFETHVPNQDRNKKFLSKTLGNVSSMKELYAFGYENFVKKAKTIDVSWFNERKMPSCLFEVEHSTQIENSLLKFVEMQDFRTDFYIVAAGIRKNEFQSKMTLTAFKVIKERVSFIDYEGLATWHTSVLTSVNAERSFRL